MHRKSLAGILPAALVVAALGAPSASASASKVCARGLDPDGGTVTARGISCSTAIRVHGELVQQTTLAPYRLRVAGRTWRCDYTSHTNKLTRMLCRSGRAAVAIRLEG